MKKALISLLAVFSVLVCIPIVAYAQIAKTADDGVAWVLGWDDGGQCEFSCEWMTVGGITYDCRWQCVDFVNAYTYYLTSTYRNGNANTYNVGVLPDYDNYSLIQKYSGFVPAKGDILIWDGGTWGHVAIVTAVNSNTEVVYSDQNGGGYTQKIHHGRKMNPNTNDYWGVIRPGFKPANPTAPTVHAFPIGKEVDLTWNDVGASSYYIYVQNKSDQSIPYGNNVGRALSIHLGLAEGDFTAYVTAVYSSDNMKTGSTEFSTHELSASVNKGQESSYDLNEPVVISINADVNTVDSCVLKIYRTPIGGDTYLYWEGQLFSPHYSTRFSNEGHYSCCFILTRNDHSIESGWVGWNIIEGNLHAAIDKGQDGLYKPNEPAVISLNADVNTVDSCVLKIYRTPDAGETYLYWEGQIFAPRYSTGFSKEGYYSCYFILTYDGQTIESGWVGWSVHEDYTVHYAANGGNGAPPDQSKAFGQPLALSLTKPALSGFAFLGWATKAEATTTEYQPGDIYREDADLTLYAVWKPVSFTLPASLTTLEDDAFAGVKDCFIRLPDHISSVSPTAFDASVTLIVKAGSDTASVVSGLGFNVIEE